MLPHARVVLIECVFQHLRVGRERVKRRQDRQRGDSGPDPSGQGDPVLDSLRGEFRPVRRYQDVGVHRPFPWSGLLGAWRHPSAATTDRQIEYVSRGTT
jgi:hypothetical protein